MCHRIWLLLKWNMRILIYFGMLNSKMTVRWLALDSEIFSWLCHKMDVSTKNKVALQKLHWCCVLSYICYQDTYTHHKAQYMCLLNKLETENSCYLHTCAIIRKQAYLLCVSFVNCRRINSGHSPRIICNPWWAPPALIPFLIAPLSSGNRSPCLWFRIPQLVGGIKMQVEVDL